MKEIESIKHIKELYETQLMLLEFIEECCPILFPNDAKRGWAKFVEGFEWRQQTGCLQSIECLHQQMEYEDTKNKE